jgi:zinc transporter
MEDAETSPGFLHLHSLKDGAQWLHMCINHKETGTYLMDVAMLDDLVVDAMIEEDTRSRVRISDDGIMVLLKAMHISQDMANPEDMVSIRVWIDHARVITTREADVDPIIALHARLDEGEGSATPGEFLADLVEEHFDEIDEHIEALEDAVNRIEEMVYRHNTEAACPSMAQTQSRISGFLRHLGPQRAVLEQLSLCKHALLSARERARIEDGLDQLLRYLETLQNLRDRIDILNNQVARIQDRRITQSSFIFSIVATLFLPLGFIVSAFGVNLPGIPMDSLPHGFTILMLVCVAISIALVGLFRFKKWF